MEWAPGKRVEYSVRLTLPSGAPSVRSLLEMPQTVLEVFDATATAFASRQALLRKRGSAWEATSWSAYHGAVGRAARALLALGVGPGQGVVILSANRPEWFVTNLAGMTVGARVAGIYTNNTAEQCRYIVEHAEAVVAVVDGPQALARLEPRPACLRAVVALEPGVCGPGVVGWDAFLAKGDAVHADEVARRRAALSADSATTLIYTSGTTGTPKAVMLTQRNLAFIAEKIQELVPIGPDDSLLSYLPLSHIAEQVVSHLLSLATGAAVYFNESLEKLPEALVEVRPHFFLGVPRVWEKMQAAIEAKGAATSPLRRRVAAWARSVGRRSGEADQSRRARPWSYPLADRLVFRTVRERLGLDRARLLAVSSAPIAKETLEFFQSLGLPIMEAYGMSECSGPATMALPERYRLGWAGYAIPGTELALGPDGEVLIRGPHVFKGYYKNDEATREAIDEGGWLHSGDVGEIDAEGYLSITDRKKELIITAGGKNIAPQHVEGQLKQIPAVSQAVAVGDRRPYLVALLTLDPARLPAEAAAAGSAARSVGEAIADPGFRAYLEKQVEAVNARLARFETVRRFTLLPRELTVEDGELTPTLKLKRRVIHERHRDAIEALYAQVANASSTAAS
jgi:long-chain acyl-CoA synthetase